MCTSIHFINLKFKFYFHMIKVRLAHAIHKNESHFVTRRQQWSRFSFKYLGVILIQQPFESRERMCINKAKFLIFTLIYFNNSNFTFLSSNKIFTNCFTSYYVFMTLPTLVILITVIILGPYAVNLITSTNVRDLGHNLL
jgi:hypothetical protein